ncbi:peptidase S8/S53 domain-containing protein [Apodospora peruviana]|uniref:Peptidase S8/S53 domain-containing protein n=1 Tax=Apodospora peruviana TaxID=516989 RepID=A0AAE0M863_9PEZI|nr:peptidase S8/S53 domain-containing protein [Apodospora peruviana]
MVRLDLLATLLAAGRVAQAVTANTPQIVPGAYIVEYENNLDTKAFLNSMKGEATLRKDLKFKLFNGASIQFKETDKAEEMAAKVADMPVIKNVWPVKRYPAPQHTVHYTGSGVKAAIEKRQAAGEPDMFTPHLMTEVNKFRDAGETGKGIRIGIIDTGTDYLHPALGGCFGEGCLVSYGADLVGDAFNGKNTPRPDSDPLDNCNGHGTHVAGIIAAQSNNPYGIIGAAQGVTLGSYRVFGCSGDVGNDILIAAYNMAYEAGSDIITASIGGPSGWAEDPWAEVVSRIVEDGVPCVVSAGNDGSEGLFYASTAANGRKVTAIASTDNTLSPALLTNGTYTVDGGGLQAFGFTAGEPGAWANVSLPLWTVNFNTSDAANSCDPFPDSTPDLSGYIVLIRRGTCTFVQKIQNARAKGAKYVLFYNNVVGTASVSGAVAGVLGVAMTTAEQGEAFIKALAAGSKVVVNMADPETAPKFLMNFNNTLSSGFASTYTSWGPTFEVDVKPQFSAPGGMILATYPRALGTYAVLSGTSMACPLAAAVYALVMNYRKTKDPKTLENLLSSTAHPNSFHDGRNAYDILAPVPQQGGGLIQAWTAAHATTLLSVSSLSFNDTDHFVPVRNFSISNTASTAITYQLSHIGAATGYTLPEDGSIKPDTFPNELTDDFATLSFSPAGNITIPPGQRKIISVRASPPTGLNAKRLPVYSGYVAINGSDGSALSLPYLGVAGSLHGATVLDTSATVLSRSKDAKNGRVAANTTFLLPPPGHSNDTAFSNSTDLPKLVIELAMGSALVRVDVVPVSNCSAAAKNATTVFGTKTLGQPADFPLLYNPRGTLEAPWDGKMVDGSYAPAGTYKFAVKALRIFGDPSLATEYDAGETVQFRIRYQTAFEKRNPVVPVPVPVTGRQRTRTTRNL